MEIKKSIGDFRIEKGSVSDIKKLLVLAITTFKESHGHSAPSEDIQKYLENKFTKENLLNELRDEKNVFYLCYNGNELAGYSKIIFNCSYNDKTPANSTKLERLYVLEKFHGAQIGQILMDFAIQLARDNKQQAVWLYVWTENHRAIRFYKKYGFHKIAETFFKISDRHENPNDILYLEL